MTSASTTSPGVRVGKPLYENYHVWGQPKTRTLGGAVVSLICYFVLALATESGTKKRGKSK